MKTLLLFAVSLTVSNCQLLGGARETAIEDAIIAEVAHFAVSSHPGETSEDGFYDALEKINKAEKQTVAGTLYTLDLQVGASGCTLKSEYDRARCKVKASSASRRCIAKVHVQVWMKPQNAVTEWNCES
ncbi:salivary cystatin-L2 [Galendromus occidentalis]|uniref:Salivary cystatin-L2 n=1 Tax=Galendromus occidentalis TaxID=34638 RepID=A0AAJ6VV07_9ACAR|nr:salivary cystatin-L2 [Galendromus occidentalis]